MSQVGLDEIMTEDPGNHNGRMSKNPRRYCRIEAHGTNNDPKSCKMEISPEIKKFQEGSGMFGHN